MAPASSAAAVTRILLLTANLRSFGNAFAIRGEAAVLHDSSIGESRRSEISEIGQTPAWVHIDGDRGADAEFLDRNLASKYRVLIRPLDVELRDSASALRNLQ